MCPIFPRSPILRSQLSLTNFQSESTTHISRNLQLTTVGKRILHINRCTCTSEIYALLFCKFDSSGTCCSGISGLIIKAQETTNYKWKAFDINARICNANLFLQKVACTLRWTDTRQKLRFSRNLSKENIMCSVVTQKCLI